MNAPNGVRELNTKETRNQRHVQHGLAAERRKSLATACRPCCPNRTPEARREISRWLARKRILLPSDMSNVEPLNFPVSNSGCYPNALITATRMVSRLNGLRSHRWTLLLLVSSGIS